MIIVRVATLDVHPAKQRIQIAYPVMRGLNIGNFPLPPVSAKMVFTRIQQTIIVHVKYTNN
jgi:hypothetical protein